MGSFNTDCLMIRPDELTWYANTEHHFYTAYSIYDKTTNMSTVEEEEFKSDEFITPNNKNDELLDFGVFKRNYCTALYIESSQFNYQRNNQFYYYCFKIGVFDPLGQLQTIELIPARLKDQTSSISSPGVKVTDTFVQKYGHLDINVFGKNEEMSFDGYSVGIKGKLTLGFSSVSNDCFTTIDFTIRGNIDKDDLTKSPVFKILLTSDHDTIIEMSVVSNDPAYKNVPPGRTELKAGIVEQFNLVGNKSEETISQIQDNNKLLKETLMSCKTLYDCIDWHRSNIKCPIDWDKEPIEDINKKIALLSPCSLPRFIDYVVKTTHLGFKSNPNAFVVNVGGFQDAALTIRFMNTTNQEYHLKGGAILSEITTYEDKHTVILDVIAKESLQKEIIQIKGLLLDQWYEPSKPNFEYSQEIPYEVTLSNLIGFTNIMPPELSVTFDGTNLKRKLFGDLYIDSVLPYAFNKWYMKDIKVKLNKGEMFTFTTETDYCM